MTAPVQGQSQSGHEQGIYSTPSSGSEASHQVPEWAEPESRSSGVESQSQTFLNNGVQTKAPSPPDNPSRVPVDGGVALLAVAGAGYAVRKLNEEEEEDEPA